MFSYLISMVLPFSRFVVEYVLRHQFEAFDRNKLESIKNKVNFFVTRKPGKNYFRFERNGMLRFSLDREIVFAVLYCSC